MVSVLAVLTAAVVIYVVQALFVCVFRLSHVIKLRKWLKKVGPNYDSIFPPLYECG